MVTFTGSGHDIDFGWGHIFRENPNLLSVKLPEGITRIGTWMFQKSENLSLVNIPSTVTDIEVSAFEGTKIMRDFKESNEENLYIDNRLIVSKEALR